MNGALLFDGMVGMDWCADGIPSFKAAHGVSAQLCVRIEVYFEYMYAGLRWHAMSSPRQPLIGEAFIK